MLALRNVTCIYPGVIACRDVTLTVRPHEIQVLLGDNGAGKSTVVKIMGGLTAPSSGTVEIDGQSVRLTSPQHARKLGIGVVHQFGALIDGLTAEENLRLVIRDKRRIREALASADIARKRLVRDLSPRERQLLSIVRFIGECRYLLLDEPSALLSRQESRELFSDLRKLASEGYGILVVSHKLPEVVEHGDEFTVLRKGSVTAHFARGQTSLDELETLLGPPLAPKTQTRPERESCPVARLRHVSTGRAADGDAALERVDLDIRRGEILGVAGPPGSGARNVLRLLYGVIQPTSGIVEWTSREPRLGVIPERRIGEGAIASFTLAQNLALRRRDLFKRRSRSALQAFAFQMVTRYRITPPNISASAAVLSGGNLQKLIIAREADYGRDLMIAINPTAGLDRPSVAFVLEELRKHAASGAAVAVFSDDREELIPLCDRWVFMERGVNIREIAGTGGVASRPDVYGSIRIPEEEAGKV